MKQSTLYAILGYVAFLVVVLALFYMQGIAVEAKDALHFGAALSLVYWGGAVWLLGHKNKRKYREEYEAERKALLEEAKASREEEES